MKLTSTTTVLRPPEEVYAFWRDLSRLPTFMVHLDEVRETGPSRSHWRASAPFGQTVVWEGRDHARRARQRDRLALGRRRRHPKLR